MKNLNKRNNIILALFLILFSSCSSYLNYFQTAQQSFNQAAEAENAIKTNPNTSATVLPESNYRMARTFIMKAMGDSDEPSKYDKTDLAKDGLLLNAYAIKALSEWKLGMYQEAIKTSRNCQLTFGNDKSVQTQRDYIIVKALESLIYNDSIEQYTATLDIQKGKSDLTAMDKSSLVNLKKGFDILQEQRAALPADHPVQSYLIISQLSLAKNWKNLYTKLQQQLRRVRSPKLSAFKQETDQIKTKLNATLTTTFKNFGDVLGDKKHALYQQWKKAHVDVEGI